MSVATVAFRLQGKVRDVYELEDKLVIVTTDRQSAFDRLLAAVPYKVSLHSQLAMCCISCIQTAVMPLWMPLSLSWQ